MPAADPLMAETNYVDDLLARKNKLDRRQAELLKRAIAARQMLMPQGQMVSGQYVAPHWSQQLNAAINQAGIPQSIEQGMLDQEQRAYEAAEAAAATDFMNRMPQAQPQHGPTQPNEAPLPDVQPSRQDKLKYLQEGTRIPSLRDTLTKAFEDQLVNEPVREEQRQFRGQEAAANRQARAEAQAAELAQRAEAARQRAEDQRLSREERAAAAREANATRLQIAQLAADARRDVAAAVRAGKPDPADKPLPPAVVTKLGDQSRLVEDTARFRDTFKDDFAGLGSSVRRAAGAYAPEVLQTKGMKETSAWWNDYQAHKNTVRHNLFGAALTRTERAEWEKADVNPDMNPDQIRANLNRRAELEQRAYEKMEAAARAGTRTEQLDALRPNTGPATVSSDADYAKLPSGAVFVGPDGKQRRKP